MFKGDYMKKVFCFILIAGLFSFAIMACGTNSSSASQPGADIIQQYNLHVEGEPTSRSITLPRQFEGNWDSFEHYCGIAGFDLIPYAGDTVSFITYHVTETQFGSLLDLVVLAKDQTIICGYLSGRPRSDVGLGGSGMVALNDPNIVHPSN